MRRPPLPEGPYLIVGLARSGAAAARMLREHGEVIGVDSGRPEAPDGVEAHLESDGVDLLERAHSVVKSPGVPREAPVIAAAVERGLPVLGELELAWRLLPNRFVAVTGTNGKTTTTELLGAVHSAAGLPVAVAGNVGTPLASLAEGLDPSATVVCEASSFQLEDSVAFAPECAVFLNLAPDHMDRHADLEAYLAAKLRIFANQGNDDVAVYNADDPALAGTDLGGCARRIAFCTGAAPECEVALAEGTIFYDGEPLLATSELGLFGEHNAANAMAAAAAALSMGLDREGVREGLRSFAGVPHRLELVAERGGVRFVNDSKATNVASATVGLRSFEGGVHAILGGSEKGEEFSALLDPVEERCAAVYLIGAAAERLAEALAPALAKGIAMHRCADLADATRRAAAAAGGGEVVLLSPACASFDAFESFEERGDSFRAIVEEIAR
jgi:UDP-N-acetylmuramoylalanine--D-glutamate ligase